MSSELIKVLHETASRLAGSGVIDEPVNVAVSVQEIEELYREITRLRAIERRAQSQLRWVESDPRTFPEALGEESGRFHLVHNGMRIALYSVLDQSAPMYTPIYMFAHYRKAAAAAGGAV